jgi:SAM-dependent methyltransferase
VEANEMDVPAVFSDGLEFRNVPAALELVQQTFDEEALYQAIVLFAERWYARSKQPARVLDLCAATGLCARHVAARIPIESVTLVDSDPRALEIGVWHLRKQCHTDARIADAVDFKGEWPFDLVLMNSAYHHVDDDKKVAFLTNAADNLRKGGAILVGDHFLPPYEDPEEFREAVVDYYEHLVAELVRRNAPVEALNIIRRSGLYCWQMVYEYKVSWSVFVRHLSAAGLRVAAKRVVWTYQNSVADAATVGSMSLQIEPCVANVQ